MFREIEPSFVVALVFSSFSCILFNVFSFIFTTCHDEIALHKLLHPTGVGVVGVGYLVFYYRDQSRGTKLETA